MRVLCKQSFTPGRVQNEADTSIELARRKTKFGFDLDV